MTPTPTAPPLPRRGHRPKLGDALRVKVGFSCDESSRANLGFWQRTLNLSAGRTFDAMTSFCDRNGFLAAQLDEQKFNPQLFHRKVTAKTRP
jgi:hypothetical protein